MFLARLAKSGKQQRKRLIENASLGQLNAVRNICYSVCGGKYTLPPVTLRKLKKCRKNIRNLACKKKYKKHSALKKAIQQSGGFLPALIGPILRLIASLGASSLLSGAIAK